MHRSHFQLQPEIEELAKVRSTDAYASVGGLDKQVSQIRDLLEIPLTRPDLFRHFGNYVVFVIVI
jgi:AAA family ATPase